MKLMKFQLIAPRRGATLERVKHIRIGGKPITIADRYNTQAARLLPHMAADRAVEPTIASASEIDEIVFRRSEFLGMACVILVLIEQQDQRARP